MAVHNDYVLSGIFTTKGYRIHLLLTKENISWEIENVPKSQTVIPLRCLIAANPCDCTGVKQTKPLHCYFCQTKNVTSSPFEILSAGPKSMRLHYAVPFGRHRWKLDSQIFHPGESTDLQHWIDTLHETLKDLHRPKHLLIFVNPFGGKKKGIKIYDNKVVPILKLAGIVADVVVTQRANHAKEMIEDISILKYDGIICVGGDGLFSEILNSVILKTQKEKSIDVNDVYNTLMVPRIPLGIIPAGSTNAAVNSITGSSDPVSATLLIVMGEYTGVDVCGVYSSGSFLRFAVTFLSYGYFGDVVRDSEKLRWMGPKRYSITGFKKILCRKLYEGELQLQIEVPMNHRSSWERDYCGVNCETCLKASHLSQSDGANSTKKVSKYCLYCWLILLFLFLCAFAHVIPGLRIDCSYQGFSCRGSFDFYFLSPIYRTEKVLFSGKIFETEFSPDLHVLRSPESENHVFREWSVCLSVNSIAQKRIVVECSNWVC